MKKFFINLKLFIITIFIHAERINITFCKSILQIREKSYVIKNSCVYKKYYKKLFSRNGKYFYKTKGNRIVNSICRSQYFIENENREFLKDSMDLSITFPL